MINQERHIGICGTFDVENYGDLLFPLIAEAELRRRLGALQLHRFSYHRKSPDNWPFAVTSLADLPAAAGGLDGMIIGGGDIIRFDQAIAPGYFPLTPDLHHPTGYWLTPMLMALQHGRPVVWNAPGVHGVIPTWAEPLLKLTVTQCNYVSVRDEASRRALGCFAKKGVIQVVPDTAFGVAQLINGERPSAEYLRLRESLGLKAPYIIVQATTGLEAFSRLVRNYPEAFREHQLVILPIGPVLGDDATSFGDSLPGSIRLTTWPSPLLLTELIGHAAAAVGISLHLTIAALAFGVPVFRPAGIFDGKYAVLLEFNTVTTFDNSSEIDPQWFAAKLGRTTPSAAVQAAVSQLSKHWDCIAASFVVNDARPATLETLARFWQSLPSLLEAGDTRCEMALAERDAMRIECDAMRTERDAIYDSNSWKITAPLRALDRCLWRQKTNNGE